MSDCISVPLDLEDLDVVSSSVVNPVLEAEVVSTLPRACVHCGSVDVIGHGRCRRRLRHLRFGYPVVLVSDQRRHKRPGPGVGQPGAAPRDLGPETGDGPVP